MDTIIKLDIILNIFERFSYLRDAELQIELDAVFLHTGRRGIDVISNVERSSLIEYLLSEEYLRQEGRLTTDCMYYITIKGILFYEKGGYRGEIKRINAATVKQATEDLRNEQQFWVTVSLGISTGIAAIYYLFALFDFYQNHTLNWKYTAYFLSGLGFGLSTFLLRSLLSKAIKNRESK